MDTSGSASFLPHFPQKLEGAEPEKPLGESGAMPLGGGKSVPVTLGDTGVPVGEKPEFPPVHIAPPVRLLPLVPIATKEIGEEILGGSLSELQVHLGKLQTDRNACVVGQRSISGPGDITETVSKIDVNIGKIQARIIKNLAEEVRQGNRLTVDEKGVLQATEEPGPTSPQALRTFIELVSSLPEPIDEKTRDSVLEAVKQVFQSPIEVEGWWAQEKDAEKSLPTALYRMFEKLFPGEKAETLVNKLGGPPKATETTTALPIVFFVADRHLRDCFALREIESGDIEKCSSLSDDGLRSYSDKMLRSISVVPHGSPQELTEHLTILREAMEGRRGFEVEVERIDQALEELQSKIESVQGRGRSGEDSSQVSRARRASTAAVEKPREPISGPKLETIEKIGQMRSITQQLGSKGKIVMKGKTFALGERETGIKKFMSELVGRGTGWSEDARQTAIGFMQEMQNMLASLEGKDGPVSQKCRDELQEMLMDLSSSEWFHGVLQHHSAVGKKFSETAMKILPEPRGEGLGIWNRLNMNLKGEIPSISKYINNSIETATVTSVEKEIEVLSGVGEKSGIVQIEQGRVRAKCLLSLYPAARSVQLHDHLTALEAHYENLREKVVKPHVEAEIDRLGALLGEEKATPNDIYSVRHQIDALRSIKYPQDSATLGTLDALSDQCETKLIELGIASSTTMLALQSEEAEMKGKALQEFRTCFRNVSLRGKQKLKESVSALPNGDVKKSLQRALREEEQKWAFQMALRPQGAEASLSKEDHEALVMEQALMEDYQIKFKAAKEKKASLDKASREVKTKKQGGEAVQAIEVPLPPTPLIDAMNMVKAFKSKSTARISPYFENRIQLFDTLIEISKEVVGDEEITACADCVKDLLREQRGTSVSVEEVGKRVVTIAENLGRAASDENVSVEIKAELKKPEMYVTEPPFSPVSSLGMIREGVDEGERSSKAVKIIAGDLFAHTAAAFLNDSIADIRLAQSSKYNQQLSRAGIEIKNYVVSDILSAPDLETAQKKCQFWLAVAEECRENGNLTALSMIIGTLNDALVSKLIPQKEHRFDSYRSRLDNLNGLLSAEFSFGRARAYQRERLGAHPPMPLVPFLMPFDFDFEHVKENTHYAEGEVVEEIASEMAQIRGGLEASIPQGIIRQTTDLSEHLKKVKPMPSTDLAMCKFIPSMRILGKVDQATKSLGDKSIFEKQGVPFSSDLVAVIDLEEKCEFTSDGMLVSGSDTKGSIYKLKTAYEKEIMEPARAVVGKLKDPATREGALQDLETMSRFLTPKSRIALQNLIDEANLEGADLEEAKLVLDPFKFAKKLVTRLSDPDECNKAVNVLKRIFVHLTSDERKQLTELKNITSVQISVSEAAKKIFQA